MDVDICPPTQPPLLPYQHLACGSEIARSQRIKVETTRNTLTDSIPTIPIRRTATALIDTRMSIS